MSAFRISGFSGLVPRLAKQLLAPHQAQVATNCDLTSGDLRPRNGPKAVFTAAISNDIVSMFRMEKDGNEKWLAWDREVDVARSPVAGNTSRRFYYTGDGEPRVSDYDTATRGPGPYPSGCFVLGVTPPLAAPSISVSGGAGDTVTRAYVYTFVTAWGEESKPSPATTATGNTDGNWMLSSLDVPPRNSGTVTGASRNTPTAGYVEVMLDSVSGLRAHEEISFASVSGMTDLNATFAIRSVDAGRSRIVIPLSTPQNYIAGGNVVTRGAS